MARPPNRLYREVAARGIPVRKACEVGVYLPETSNVLDFVEGGTPTLLVEPEPKSVAAIRQRFAGCDNVELLPVAIYSHNGTLTLAKAESSTFVSDLPSSPALVNDGYERDAAESLDVPCRIFGDVDPGDIDLLSVDTEGSEWYVLSTMRSRPAVISLETHGRFYVNPFMPELADWLSANGYRAWYKDKSDTVYFREGTVQMGAGDRLRLGAMEVYLRLRRARGALRR